MRQDKMYFKDLEKWDVFTIEPLGFFLKAEPSPIDSTNAILLTGAKLKCYYFEPFTEVVKFK